MLRSTRAVFGAAVASAAADSAATVGARLTTDAEVKHALANLKNVAIVGFSQREERPSNYVAQYLHFAGMKVTGVNPVLRGQVIDGIPCVATLAEVHNVQLVDVFRASEHLPEVVAECIELKKSGRAPGLELIWLQLGVSDAEAERAAHDAGFATVHNRCAQSEHQRLISIVRD